MALTTKKLDKVEKQLEAAGLEPAQLADLKKSIAGVRAAMEGGETFSKSDLNEILGGEVEVTELPASVVTKGNATDDDHPVGPVLMGLFNDLYADRIQKGASVDGEKAAFEKAYQDLADIFDVAIDAACQATAIEFGKGSQVNFGKKKKAVPAAEDCDDDVMEKMLKGSPAGMALLKKMSDLTSEVSLLRGERDTAVFTKQALDIGEGASFATDLAKLNGLDPALAASITKRLSGKNALLKQNAIWGQELGDGGQGNGGDGASALEKMNTLAREVVSKSAGKTTFHKAFAEVCSQQPELYAQYQDERSAAKR